MNKTKLFVARDKAFGCYKGMVHLFADKPYRCNNGMGMEYWESEINGTIWLGDDAFPELKWEDEPKEVELKDIVLSPEK